MYKLKIYEFFHLLFVEFLFLLDKSIAANFFKIHLRIIIKYMYVFLIIILIYIYIFNVKMFYQE